MQKLVSLPFVYLASRSPRRVELLSQMGVTCESLPTDIDEKYFIGESPEAYVIRLAQEKVQVCIQRLTANQKVCPILAADTTVVLGGTVLGKPDDDIDARNMLIALSGSLHRVHTAVAMAFKNEIEVVLSTTLVEMMTLTDEQIEQYITSGEHRDKAGSYGIQGHAGAWIKRIEGSYSGVMGLPIFETAVLLRKAGIGIF
jgi:septum formation protein